MPGVRACERAPPPPGAHTRFSPRRLSMYLRACAAAAAAATMTTAAAAAVERRARASIAILTLTRAVYILTHTLSRGSEFRRAVEG